MIEKLSVTIVVNNCVKLSGLWGEHGLAMLVEWRDQGREGRILLDTGQSGMLLHNLDVLKVELDRLEAVMLSHGHYDHTGGLLDLLARLNRRVKIVVHPEFWGQRLAWGDPPRSIGSGLDPEVVAERGGDVAASAEPLRLHQAIFTTGSVPRREPLEISRGFLRERNGELTDDQVEDDMSLAVDLGEEGLVVCTGCCHAGLINTVEHIRAVSGNRRVKAIIGGLHLLNASPERLERTAAYLAELKPEIVAPLHCSGLEATSYLSGKLGGAVRFLGAGQTIDLL